MQTILNHTAMANDVAPQFLEYVGMQNERYTAGRIFYLFNIKGPANRHYKSMVTFAEWICGALGLPNRKYYKDCNGIFPEAARVDHIDFISIE